MFPKAAFIYFSFLEIHLALLRKLSDNCPKLLPDLIEAGLYGVPRRRASLVFHNSNYRHMCKLLVMRTLHPQHAGYFSGFNHPSWQDPPKSVLNGDPIPSTPQFLLIYHLKTVLKIRPGWSPPACLGWERVIWALPCPPALPLLLPGPLGDPGSGLKQGTLCC